MFGIGILELIVVFIVALIVLGPKQLPEAARTLGRWFYRIKNAADSTRREIEKEWNPTEGIHPPEDPSKEDVHQ
jgi:Tat protein translocase TatB subunit